MIVVTAHWGRQLPTCLCDTIAVPASTRSPCISQFAWADEFAHKEAQNRRARALAKSMCRYGGPARDEKRAFVATVGQLHACNAATSHTLSYFAVLERMSASGGRQEGKEVGGLRGRPEVESREVER